MKKKITVFLLLILITVLMLLTCKPIVSLGTTVDILPPKGVITYPEAGETPIKGSFVIKGTASDDEGVDKVSVKFKNVETGWISQSYSATISNAGAGEILWTADIPNEAAEAPRSGHPLVKEYPIPDGKYTALVTLTDIKGKTTELNREYSIDNTPPVFIVDRPETTVVNDNFDAVDRYGAVFSVVGQAEDRHKIEELTLQVKDSSGNDVNGIRVSKKFVGKNIKEEMALAKKTESGGYSDILYQYHKENGKPKIRAHFFLSDNARLYKGAAPEGTGNTTEWYYLKDTNMRWVLEQGYTADVINDYFAGKKGSAKLDALYDTGNETAQKVKKILEDSRIFTKGSGSAYSIFSLNPDKSPGFKVLGVKHSEKDSLDLNKISTIFFNNDQKTTILVDLIANNDGDPIVESYNLKAYQESKLKIKLYRWNQAANTSQIGSLKNKENLIEQFVFDFEKLTPEQLIEKAVDFTGNKGLRVKFDLPQDFFADKYLVCVEGQDSKGNDFEAYDNTNSAGGLFVADLVWVGDKPVIAPKAPFGYVNRDFYVSADVSALGAGGKVYYRIDDAATQHDSEMDKSSEENSTRYNSKNKISINSLGEGAHKIHFLAKDNRNQEGRAETEFIKDTQAPVSELTYPNEDTPLAGNITIIGSLADPSTGAGNSVPGSGVKKTGTKYFIGKKDHPATPDASGWHEMTTSSVATWEFKYDLNIFSADPSAYGEPVSGKEGMYDIPVYILTEDNVGNKKITEHKIRFDSEGTKPVIKVLSPENGKTLGGTIRIFGISEVQTGVPSDIGKVSIKFSRNGNFDSQADGTFGGKNWYNGGDGQVIPDTETGGGASWQITINESGQFNNPGWAANPENRYVYFTLRAWNKKHNKWGEWSQSIKIAIDDDSPRIGSPITLALQDSTSTVSYSSGIWIGKGKTLIGSLYDKSGIKELEISSKELYGSDKYDLNTALTKDYIEADTANPPTEGTGASNYKLKIPLNLDSLSDEIKARGEFSITIRIVENAAKELATEETLKFRFDITDPIGGMGERLYGGSGKVSFDTASVNDTGLVQAVKDHRDGTDGSPDYGKLKLLVDGKSLSIKGLTGSTVSFEPNISAGLYNVLLYKQPDIIFSGDSSGNWPVKGVAYDSISQAKKVKAYIKVGSTEAASAEITGSNIRHWMGNQSSWEGSLNLNALNDGHGTLRCEIYDEVGNKYSSDAINVRVKNKPVQIKKLVFKTDLSGNGSYEPNEEFEIESFGSLNDERDFRGTADVASSFTFKNPAKSALEVTLSGGTGTTAKVSLFCDSIDGTSIVSETQSITNGDYTVTLDLANKLNIGDSPKKKLFLKVTDGAVSSAGTPPWHAQADITAGLDVADDVQPRGVILPFFYNSDKTELTGDDVKLSSVKYEGGKPLGHIEISGINSLGAGIPCISGKVILRGIAYDNIRLKKLELSGPGISGVNAEFSGGSWTSSTGLTVKSSKFSNTGHYVEWEYEWNTGNPALDQKVTLKVTDAADLNNTADPAITNAEPAVKTGTRGPEDRALTLANGDKPVKHQFIRLTDENERHYLVQINEVQENNKINWFDVNVPQNIVKYALYTAESNNAQITVNIVPYITKITTKLSELGNNASVYNRTALGRYPVSDKEEITIEGFNLSGAAFELNGISLTGSAGKYGIGSAKSGALVAKVGSIESINNKNDNAKPYNQEPNKVNNDLLTDDRFIDVWEFKQPAEPVNGFISYPVLKVSPKDGSVGLAYANGVTYFNMAGFKNDAGQSDYKSARRFDMNWAQYVHTDFTFDEHGYTYGMATGVDMNSGEKVASYSKFVSRRPGKIDNLNNYGNHDDTQNGIGLRIENIGTTNDPYTVDPDRIQSPSITTVTGNASNEETFIYLAYYDTINQHIRYRWGSVAKDDASPYHKYDGQLIDLQGYGKMQEPPATSFSILAGPPAKAYPSDKGGSTQTDGVNNSGKYVSLAAVKASTAGTTHDVVTAVWYNDSSRSLMYAYAGGTETPRKDDVKWSTPVKISSGGEYVRSIADPDGGIHVAFYDSGNLKYAYKPKGNSEAWSVVIVDSYSLTGTHVSIDLARAKKDGKWIPYISYYMQGSARAKLAYLVDETAPSGTGAGSIKAGAGTDEKFTGAWEVSIVPAENRVREHRINVGVWKDTAETNYGVIKAIPSKTNSGDDGSGWVTGGNDTANPILGYAVIEDGAFETAQKK